MIRKIIKTVRSALGRDQPTIKQADDRFPGDVDETRTFAQMMVDEDFDADEVAEYVVTRTMDTALDTIEEEEQVGTYWDDRPKYDFVEKPVITFDRDERVLVIYDGEVEVRGGDDESDGIDEEQSNLGDWAGDRR